VAGTHFKPAIRLHGAHGEEVVRDIYFGKEVADDVSVTVVYTTNDY